MNKTSKDQIEKKNKLMIEDKKKNRIRIDTILSQKTKGLPLFICFNLCPHILFFLKQ